MIPVLLPREKNEYPPRDSLFSARFSFLIFLSNDRFFRVFSERFKSPSELLLLLLLSELPEPAFLDHSHENITRRDFFLVTRHPFLWCHRCP
jgi:hypothetical protein